MLLPLPSNKVVLDKYIRSYLVNFRTKRGWRNLWLPGEEIHHLHCPTSRETIFALWELERFW